MSGAWFTSTDSVLVSRFWYENEKGETADIPEEPVYYLMSKEDFVKSNNIPRESEDIDTLYDDYVATYKADYSLQRNKYKEEMGKFKRCEEPLGRFYTPILCPRDDLCFSEPQGRKFHIPLSLFSVCPSLALLSDLEDNDASNHVEGEVDELEECGRVPFHFVYCITAIQWLLWREQNKEEPLSVRGEKMRELLAENYAIHMPDEEKVERSKLLPAALSLQRENCEAVDSLTFVQKFRLIAEYGDYLGQEIRPANHPTPHDEENFLIEVCDYCQAKMCKGFTPKDFRILLNLRDTMTYDEKLELAKSLSWMNVKGVPIN